MGTDFGRKLILAAAGIAVAGSAVFGVIVRAPVIRAQSQTATRPKFEVASIKPRNAAGPVTAGVGNGGASERNVTLKMLIALAWRIQDFQISGGPGWIGSDRFDVEAK